MPSLPKKNKLDFNPNSIINASKRITAISLENLKNPILDPDQKTLSTLEASKKLDDTFAKLQDLAGLLQSGILRTQNVVASAFVDIIGAGRMRGGMNGSESSWETASSSTPSSSEYRRRIAMDRQRFRRFFPNDDRNSTATPSSSSGYFDDDASSSIPTARDFEPPFSPDYEDFEGFRGSETPAFVGFDERSVRGRKAISKERNLPSLIFFIIQTIRRMDILITSRVRPAIRDLSQPQIDLLKKIYEMVSSSYTDIIFPFSKKKGAIREGMLDTDVLGEYGDEIFDTFNTEREKLMMNINIVINSWKQNTPFGQMSEEKPVEMDKEEVEGAGRRRRGRPRKALVGSGRNFYGEKINESRDIPTIYSSLGVKNSPTKYLL